MSRPGWFCGRGGRFGADALPTAEGPEEVQTWESRGGRSLGGMAGPPLDLARAVTFSLNDIVGLWVGGSSVASDGGGRLTRFQVLRDGSATSQFAVSPFTFVGMVDRRSTASNLG